MRRGRESAISIQNDNIDREPENKNIPQKAAAGQRQPQAESDVKNRQEIASLAYALWQERGCPEGSPEQDWIQAEAMLRRAGQRN